MHYVYNTYGVSEIFIIKKSIICDMNAIVLSSIAGRPQKRFNKIIQDYLTNLYLNNMRHSLSVEILSFVIQCNAMYLISHGN